MFDLKKGQDEEEHIVEKTVTITQLGTVATTTVTYTWSFTSSDSCNWGSDPDAPYIWVSNDGGPDITYDAKKGDSIANNLLGMNGNSNSGQRRYFTFTAPAGGDLTISGKQRNVGTLTVTLVNGTADLIEGDGVFDSSSIESATYRLSSGGTVKFYSDDKCYFSSVSFSYTH